MIDLKQLTYFARLAETLNYRQAANLLDVRQPTLSQHIARLEDELGISLFDRLPSGVRLTRAGAAFLRDCGRVFFEYDRARKFAGRAGRAEVGQIAIGIFVSLSTGRQRELLTEFRRSMPEIDIDFVEGGRTDQLARLHDHRLDAAFVTGSADAVGLEYEYGWTERLYAVTARSHPLASAERIDWAALRREKIIIRGSEGNGALFDSVIPKLIGETRNITPLRVGRGALLNLVGIGQGITVVTEAATGEVFPEVVFRRIEDADATLDVGLVSHANNSNPILRRLIVLTRQMRSDWEKEAR
jgi:DNA-binding transcriptional LysR family regulator